MDSEIQIGKWYFTRQLNEFIRIHDMTIYDSFVYANQPLLYELSSKGLKWRTSPTETNKDGGMLELLRMMEAEPPALSLLLAFLIAHRIGFLNLRPQDNEHYKKDLMMRMTSISILLGQYRSQGV
jgi:hypothetical protein